MQFEFDLVPAAVGVGIYIFYLVLLRTLAPRKEAQKSKKADAFEEFPEPSAESETEGSQEPEPAPEPTSEEPEVASARPPHGRLPCRLFLAAAWVLALVVLGLELRSNVLQEPAEEVVTPAVEHIPDTSGNLTTDAPAAAADHAPIVSDEADKIEVVEPKAEAPLTQEVATVEEEDIGTGEAPFSVKLIRQAIGSESKDGVVRSAYYGTLTVGSPAIDMTVVFDTGSGHVVLPSMYCKSDTCKAHKRYRRGASKTARDIDGEGNSWQSGPRESVAVSFGTGEIEGVFVEDIICLSDVNEGKEPVNASSVYGRKECVTLSFIAATELSEDPFKSFHFDGILGLGLSGLSQSRNFNFMEIIGQSIQGMGGRTPHTFGVFLASHEKEESEIALGGWAGKHLYEDLSWSRLHDPESGHWIVPIQRIRLGEEVFPFCEDGTCRAAVDTGTSLLSVPTAAFRPIYEALRHAPASPGHCLGHGPLLHIELEHFTLSLGPKDYSQVRKTHRKSIPKPHFFEGKPRSRRADLRCLPMLMTLDLEEPLGPKLFILGEPVLRKYYTVYDGNRLRVGIGRAKHLKRPTREELLEKAPEVEPVSKHRLPTMFDVFRWRKALQ